MIDQKSVILVLVLMNEMNGVLGGKYGRNARW
jgi:hypothetical protein